jgi:hypothetical protein
MALNASGPISLGGPTSGQSINLELGLSATARISLNDAAVRTLLGVESGAITVNNAYGKSNISTPEYWWRADSGLSTSGWNAYAGGLDFTFANVSSADGTNGVYFNGSSGYGLTGNSGSIINAKHIMVRGNSLSYGCVLGGTHNNIHECLFTTNGNYIVDCSAAGYRYATTNVVAGSTLTWIDFITDSSPGYWQNTATAKTGNGSVYAGTYTNAFSWPSGHGIYLGRRLEVPSYLGGYIKEVAIFTSAITVAQAKAFRDTMYTRWP